MAKPKPLFDPDKLPKDEMLIRGVQGQMNYFPLCCSTGILEQFQATEFKEKSLGKPALADGAKIASLTNAKYIDDAIRAMGRSSSYIMPVYFARWYAMSLIYRKHAFGHDRHGPGAYSGFKCAQVTMFDRLLEDKDPAKGFKFTYNMTYAISHLIEWLRENGSQYGDVLISPPVPGAHGARVYGCIFTGDVDALKKYHDERLPVVKEHFLGLHEHFKSKGATQVATPKDLPKFVSF